MIKCKKLRFNIHRSVSNLLGKDFIKNNFKKLGLLSFLLILLFFSIFLFYETTFKDEKATKSIYIDYNLDSISNNSSIGEGNAKIAEDSRIYISYVPGGKDKILFDIGFKFSNLNPGDRVNLLIRCDGLEDDSDCDIKESWTYENTHCFEIDPKGENSFRVSPSFYCNLFEDKLGDVKLNLYLSSDDFEDIDIYFCTLSDLNLFYMYPEPQEKSPGYLKYEYNFNHEDHFDGFCLKGNNPSIEKKSNKVEFFFGVLISILVSSIVAISIEILKDEL